MSGGQSRSRNDTLSFTRRVLFRLSYPAQGSGVRLCWLNIPNPTTRPSVVPSIVVSRPTTKAYHHVLKWSTKNYSCLIHSARLTARSASALANPLSVPLARIVRIAFVPARRRRACFCPSFSFNLARLILLARLALEVPLAPRGNYIRMDRKYLTCRRMDRQS